MYRYEKRESRAKKVFGTLLLIIVVSVTSIFLYKMYLNINIKSDVENIDGEGTVIRLSTEQNEENISNTLEDTTKCVVGISKLKNNGDSIFETNRDKKFKFGYGNNNFRQWIYNN